MSTETTEYPWIPDGSSADDWQYAIEAAVRDTATADAPPKKTEPLTMADVARVDTYSISYHDEKWVPGDPVGSELGLYAILQLTDGRWASLEGWNDYTGWGCQDGAAVRIGPDRESVVQFGLTEEGRRALAAPEGPAAALLLMRCTCSEHGQCPAHGGPSADERLIDGPNGGA